MAIKSVYLATRQPRNYHRPMVKLCKNIFKEANAKKTPVLTLDIKKKYCTSNSDEYVAFPSKAFHIEEPICLTYRTNVINLHVTNSTSYRCVGIEVKDILMECWVPIEENFFEKLLIEQEFSETKNYTVFKNINSDTMIKGKFKIEDGFLRLDLENK